MVQNENIADLATIEDFGIILHTKGIEVQHNNSKTEVQFDISEPKAYTVSAIISDDKTTVETFSIRDTEENVQLVISAEDAMRVLKAAIDMTVKQEKQTETISE